MDDAQVEQRELSVNGKKIRRFSYESERLQSSLSSLKQWTLVTVDTNGAGEIFRAEVASDREERPWIGSPKRVPVSKFSCAE